MAEQEFTIVLSKSAARFIRNLDNQQRNMMLNILEEIRQFPLEGKALVGNLKGKFSWRVGKYRVIYQIVDNQLIIQVVDIGLRKKVYD